MRELLGFLCALCLLAGCYSAYEPAPVTAPLLAARNDFAFSAGGLRVGSGVMKGGHVDGAWAPTESSRVVAGGSYVKDVGGYFDGPGEPNPRASTRNHDAYLGVGYGARRRHTRLEALGMLGYGRFRTTECDFGVEGRAETCTSAVRVRGQLLRLSLQAHVGLVFPYWEGAVGLRVSQALFIFDRVEHIGYEELVRGDEERAFMPVVEPLVVQRAGYKWIKLELQVMAPIMAFNPPRESRDTLVKQPTVRASLGLHVSVLELWRSLR